MEKYQKVKVLGKGSFGSAILIKRKADGALFVVKEVSLSKMSKKEREEARNECSVLQQLHHPNIVRYVEQFENRNNLYIVMEYCDDGDLSGKIKQCRGRMKESSVMYYFSQICLAMEYLHSRHILHRDIKTMNVFLMKNGAVKLGDFGISTVLRNTMGMANTVCGTPYYFSPELCRNKPYNNKSDIWAMGVLLYECATGGRHPFDGQSMNQLMQRIVKNSYPPLSSQYSGEFRKMVDWCLQKDPARRPSIKQLLAYPLVQHALEMLEENLMLATQCRVRLKDIIDFDSGMDNRSERNEGGAGASPSHPPSPGAQAGAAKPLPAGVSPGQAAAMAMAKQQLQAPAARAASPSASPGGGRPASPGALVSPKPGSRQTNGLLDRNGMVNRDAQNRHAPVSPGAAAAAAAARQPSSHSPSASPRAHADVSAAHPAEAHAGGQVVVPGNRDPRSVVAGGVSPRNNVNLGGDGGGVANRGDRFSADMNRVEGIIAKYGRDLNPKAKETIHAYMRRKQEEYLARQKDENERLARRNDLRQRELKRVLDQQRRLAQNSPQNSPQRSPPRSPRVSAAGGGRPTSPRAAVAQPKPVSGAAAEPSAPLAAPAAARPQGFGRDPRLGAGAVGAKPTSPQARRTAANSPGLVLQGHRPEAASPSPSAARNGDPSSSPRAGGGVNGNHIREERERIMQEILEREKDMQQRAEAREKAEVELKQRQERNRMAVEQQRLRAAAIEERVQNLRRGSELKPRPVSPPYSLGLVGSPPPLEPRRPRSEEPQPESPRRLGALKPLSPRSAGMPERSPVVSRPSSQSGARPGYSPRATPTTAEATAAEQRRQAYLEQLQMHGPEHRGSPSPPFSAHPHERKDLDLPTRSNGLPPMRPEPVLDLVPSTGVSGAKDVPDTNLDPIRDALRVLKKRASMGVGAPTSDGTSRPVGQPLQLELGAQAKQPHRRIGAEQGLYDGMLRSPDTRADERFLNEKASNNVAMPSMLDTLRTLRDEKEKEKQHGAQEPHLPIRAESNPQLALLKQRQQRLSNAPLPALPANQHHTRSSSAATEPVVSSHPDEPASRAVKTTALSLADLKEPASLERPKDGRYSPSPPQQTSPSRGRRSLAGGGGTDAYSEMLQHLKDLLQKRRVVQPVSAVSPTVSSPSPTLSAGLSDAAQSPPSLAYTKAQNAPAITIEFSDVDDDDGDDDFEDAVPLSPVRCTEINDARTRANGGQRGDAGSEGETQGIYGADAFLGGKALEEEEELGDDGYTGYYKLPSPTSLYRN